jgi:hypothetical protein
MQNRTSGGGCGGCLVSYLIVLGILTFLAVWGFRADIAAIFPAGFWIIPVTFFLGGLVVAYLAR